MKARGIPQAERRILVRGTGVVGLCVAVELAKRGLAVEVAEPAGVLSRASASWNAAGLLTFVDDAGRIAPLLSKIAPKSIGLWKQYGVEIQTDGSFLASRGDLSFSNYPISKLPDSMESNWGWRFIQSDCHLNPRNALMTLRRLARSLGIRWRRTQSSNRYNIRVDCTGIAASDQITNLTGLRGALFIIQAQNGDLQVPLRWGADSFPSYIVPWGNRTFAVGVINTPPSVADLWKIDIVELCRRRAPWMGPVSLQEITVGTRPLFPDKMPRIICDSQTSFWVNGVYKNGFLLAPVLATNLANFITEAPLDLEWKLKRSEAATGEWTQEIVLDG